MGIIGGIGAPELVIILFVALLLFGPKNLPKLGEAMGKTVKGIRRGMDGDDEEDDAPKASSAATKKKAAAKDEAKVEDEVDDEVDDEDDAEGGDEEDAPFARSGVGLAAAAADLERDERKERAARMKKRGVTPKRDKAERTATAA